MYDTGIIGLSIIIIISFPFLFLSGTWWRWEGKKIGQQREEQTEKSNIIIIKSDAFDNNMHWWWWLTWRCLAAAWDHGQSLGDLSM